MKTAKLKGCDQQQEAELKGKQQWYPTGIESGSKRV